MSRKHLVLALLGLGAITAGWVLLYPPGSDSHTRRPLHRDARPALIEGIAASLIVPSESALRRLIGSAADTDGLLLRVYTPLPPGAEWTGDSPKELRIVGGAAGADAVYESLDGIAGAVEALASAAGMDPALAKGLRTALDRLERAANGETGHPARALFCRGAFSGTAPPLHGAGVAFSDRNDPFLDAKRSQFDSGVRLLANRIEGQAADGGTSLVIRSGAVHVAGDGIDATGVGADQGLAVSLVRPISQQFGRDRAPIMGIGLGPGGDIVVFGVGETIRHLAPDPKLKAALLAVLRRI